jgi:hypothetical protein
MNFKFSLTIILKTKAIKEFLIKMSVLLNRITDGKNLSIKKAARKLTAYIF